VDALAARVLKGEHIIYPQAVRDFVEGRISFAAPAARFAA
jgi:folate-dependent phosphoribosylglycinamide formyltransferase PurN